MTRWNGDMLDRPEMVAAFSSQLRTLLREYAELLGNVGRDAEAMWAENPPPEYGRLEAWWRHLATRRPLRRMQRDLEDAIRQTYALEARYRRNYHQIPKERARSQAQRPAVERGPAPRPMRRADQAPPLPTGQDTGEVSFLDLVRTQRKGRSA